MSARRQLPVEIARRRYSIEVTALRRETIDAQRQLVDQQAEPGEHTLSTGGVWKRTAEDFQLGAGQDWFDLPDQSSRRRFRHSQGIDPWTKRSLRLHHDALGSDTAHEDARSYNTSWEQTGLIVANEKLFALVGSTLQEVDDPTDLAWSLTQRLTIIAVEILSATTDGIRVWVCGNADRVVQMWDADSDTADTSWSTRKPYLLGYANGRLLAAGDDTVSACLYELNNTGGRRDLYDHPSPMWRWKCIVGAPNGIYVAGYQGDHSEIYLVTNIDATGGLNAPFHVASLPDGELIQAMTYYGGLMILGTSRGVRLAQIGGSGFLTYGPLLEMPDPVVCFEPQGEFVWFNYTDPDDVTNQGLGRLSLARFVEPMLPAWAPDLTGVRTETGWKARSVVTWNGKRYFSMSKTGAGNGGRFYGENDTYIEAGVYRSGRITFGTPEEKGYLSVDVHTDPLVAGDTIAGEITREVEQATPLAGWSQLNGRDHRWVIKDLVDEWAELELTITRGDDTELTPVLQRWTMRGMPSPFRVQEIWLPVILANAVAHRDNPVGMNPWTEFQFFSGLLQSHEVVDVALGKETFRAYVDSLGQGIDSDGKVDKWDDDEEWFEGVLWVKLVTVDA